MTDNIEKVITGGNEKKVKDRSKIPRLKFAKILKNKYLRRQESTPSNRKFSDTKLYPLK